MRRYVFKTFVTKSEQFTRCVDRIQLQSRTQVIPESGLVDLSHRFSKTLVNPSIYSTRRSFCQLSSWLGCPPRQLGSTHEPTNILKSVLDTELLFDEVVAQRWKPYLAFEPTSSVESCSFRCYVVSFGGYPDPCLLYCANYR